MTSRVLVALRIAASPGRVFAACTAETGQWWRPHGLFELNGRRDGRLAVEAGVACRITERYPDGAEFEVGRVRVWDPPRRLVFSWRAATFPPDRETEVHVRFEDVDDGTRVVVEHFGLGRPRGRARRAPRLPVAALPAAPGAVVAGAARRAGRPDQWSLMRALTAAAGEALRP